MLETCFKQKASLFFKANEQKHCKAKKSTIKEKASTRKHIKANIFNKNVSLEIVFAKSASTLCDARRA